MSFESSQKFQPQTMPKEEFFAKARPLTEAEARKLGASEKKKDSRTEQMAPILSASFQNPETGLDQKIEINLEEKLVEFRAFYKDKFDLNINELEIKSIWNKNYVEIKNEVEKYGYDSILIVPDDLPGEPELNQKSVETMYDGVGRNKVEATKYWADQNSINSVGEKKYRIILVHSAQNLADQPLLKATKGKSVVNLTSLDKPKIETMISGGQELGADFEVEINGKKMQIKADSLSLEEYEIFQRVYFEKTGKHLDESGWTWLMKSRSGSRVVDSNWNPDDRQLNVNANDPDNVNDNLGLRLSRSLLPSSSFFPPHLFSWGRHISQNRSANI